MIKFIQETKVQFRMYSKSLVIEILAQKLWLPYIWTMQVGSHIGWDIVSIFPSQSLSRLIADIDLELGRKCSEKYYNNLMYLVAMQPQIQN